MRSVGFVLCSSICVLVCLVVSPLFFVTLTSEQAKE